MEFHYSNKHVGQVKERNFIGGLNKQTFDLKKPGIGLPELPKISTYPQKCAPININKINDLAYIPADIVGEFYSKMYDWPTIDMDDIELF